MSTAQKDVDHRNAEFWNELCGTALARRVGVTNASADSLARFDAAYLGTYPYLKRYLPASLAGRRVLEVGLGYGTLGQILVERGADYYGLDIAAGPVEMMRHRLSLMGSGETSRRVSIGSALDIPHDAGSFDLVVSIGCLHHTGDVPRAISEVHRVLAQGGSTLVMLYHSRSFRRLANRVRRRVGLGRSAEREWARYDANAAGEPAPVTEFFSRAQVFELFGNFSSVHVRAENFDDISLLGGRFRVRREWLLGSIARLGGLDLYVTAVKTDPANRQAPQCSDQIGLQAPDRTLPAGHH